MGLEATALPVLVMSCALIASYWLGNSSGGCCAGALRRQLMLTVWHLVSTLLGLPAAAGEVVVHFGLVCLFAACVL